MKKVLYLLTVAAIATLSFVACSKQNEPDTRKVEKAGALQTIHFNASAQDLATKSVFGEKTDGAYPTVWTDTKNVRISLVGGGSYEATVIPGEDPSTAEFDVSIETENVTTYQFRVVSPATAANNLNSKVTIPASQAPTAASVDENAHLMVAVSEQFNEMPASVPLTFTHIAAYGKFTLSNFPANVTINSIELTADANLAGEFNVNYTTTPPTLTTVSPKREFSNTITLTPAQGATTFWFALNPVNLEGKDMTITVKTDIGPFTKTVTFPSGKGDFKAGQVASFSLNMTGTEPVYTLVTDYAELTEGSEVIIAAKSYDYAITFNITKDGVSDNYGLRIPVTKNENTLVSPVADVQRFVLMEGISANTVQFACQGGNYDGEYIGANTYDGNIYGGTKNYLKKYAASDQHVTDGYTSFQINLTNGEIFLDANSFRYGKLCYHPSNEVFEITDYYADNYYVAIYKLEGSGADGKQLITPDPEIVFSGVSVNNGSYELGDAHLLPSTGGEYEVGYTINYPGPLNNQRQFAHSGTYNDYGTWANGDIKVTIDDEAAVSGTFKVVLKPNTTGADRRCRISLVYWYQKDDGTYSDDMIFVIWIGQSK